MNLGKGSSVKRKLLSLASAGLFAVGIVGFAPSAQTEAHAGAATNCEYGAHPHSSEGRTLICHGGSGEYRLVLRCNEGSLFGTDNYTLYGKWVSAGEYSIESCAQGYLGGFYRGHGMQFRS